MIAYTLDLRQRIIDAVEQNIYSKREIAEIFGIHESFIYKLLRQRCERGNIAPLPHGGGAKPKLTETHAQTLASLSAAHPDATLAELGTGHSALHIMPTAWPREGWVVARKGQAGRREVSDMR
ncbi:MAG: helix-turn-helix domain-containing protein [Actinomycetota bacterium]